MRLLSVIIIFLVAVSSSCTQKNNYEKQTSVLDSLKIVLQVKLNELKKAEVNVQNTNFSKYDSYRKFLNSNLTDTIGKAHANALQSFLISGKAIQQFNEIKPELVKETEMSISQIQKLSGDLKNNTVPVNSVANFVDIEKKQADKLINVIEQDMRTLNISLINFRNSVPKTEDLIRHINNGRLPVLVNDSTSE